MAGFYRVLKFSLRISKPNDEPVVTKLLEASYPVLMAGSYDQALLAAALPMMTRAMPDLLSAGTYYLAESSDGQTVGCGGWTPERPGAGDREPQLAHIRHFATHPDWVRRGVGRAIFEKCREDARFVGVRRLECYASLNAERFYAALGFRVIHHMDLRLGQTLNIPSVLMEQLI